MESANCWIDEAENIEWIKHLKNLNDILHPLNKNIKDGMPKCDTAIERFMPPLPEPVSTLTCPSAYGLETADIISTLDGTRMEVIYKYGNTLTVKELAEKKENRKQRRKLAQKLR